MMMYPLLLPAFGSGPVTPVQSLVGLLTVTVNPARALEATDKSYQWRGVVNVVDKRYYCSRMRWQLSSQDSTRFGGQHEFSRQSQNVIACSSAGKTLNEDQPLRAVSTALRLVTLYMLWVSFMLVGLSRSLAIGRRAKISILDHNCPRTMAHTTAHMLCCAVIEIYTTKEIPLPASIERTRRRTHASRA